LFLVIFVETGLVVMPFLPGDSLLFAAGALAGRGVFSPWLLVLLLPLAAIVGDNVNYGVGTLLRSRVKGGHRIPLVKPKHIDRTHAFFEKYGPKAVILARFVPIVRTMTPFCAGVGSMPYLKFLAYSFVGGIGWVAIFIVGGYYLGRVKVVADNFSVVELAVIVISLMPIAIEVILNWRHSRKAAALPQPKASEAQK
jgi:membrane-associated protein